MVFKLIEAKFKKWVFNKKWRKKNFRNQTHPFNIFDIDKVSVGDYSYGSLNILSWNNMNEKLSIGRFCSIATNVTFILGGNHHYEALSNFSFRYFFGNEPVPGHTNGPINIEDGVWIGANALILSGVTIGKGAIIGAGAVVAKNIPSFAIAVGNPIRVIKYRFDKKVCEKLASIDYYKHINKNFYKTHERLLNDSLSNELIRILESLEQNH